MTAAGAMVVDRRFRHKGPFGPTLQVATRRLAKRPATSTFTTFGGPNRSSDLSDSILGNRGHKWQHLQRMRRTVTLGVLTLAIAAPVASSLAAPKTIP